MTDDTQSYNIAAIRELLLAAFTDENLRRFCQDQPLFQPIVDQFGPGYGKDDMVDEVIEYCSIQLLFPELLTAVQQANPRQYARFEGRLGIEVVRESREVESSPSTSEVVTVSSPIYLNLIRVPAGDFLMGSDMARDKDARDNELPAHSVYVSEFYIGRYPVTNLQYRAFIEAVGHRAPDNWEISVAPQGKLNHPVVNVSWVDVIAFCTWLSHETGHPFRLPTEAEWEKAARGTEGRIYSWGNELPDEARCNYDYQVGVTTTIGRYSPRGDSPYGCVDMAGNVWEWCQSLYRAYPYQADDGREDLETDGFRVLRGGSFNYPQTHVRCACRVRGNPLIHAFHSGFRVCVASRPD